MTRTRHKPGTKLNKLYLLYNFSNLDDKRVYWYCKCDCGNYKLLRANNLQSKRRTKSCGCIAGNRIRKYTILESLFRGLYHKYGSSAKERSYEFSLHRDEFKELVQSNCHYCGKEPKNIFYGYRRKSSLFYNGIDRKNNKLGYISGNCVSCCRRCNLSKNSMGLEDFYKWAYSVFTHSCLFSS